MFMVSDGERTSIEQLEKTTVLVSSPFPLFPSFSSVDDRNYPMPGRIGDASDLIGSVYVQDGKVSSLSLSILFLSSPKDQAHLPSPLLASAPRFNPKPTRPCQVTAF